MHIYDSIKISFVYIYIRLYTHMHIYTQIYVVFVRVCPHVCLCMNMSVYGRWV